MISVIYIGKTSEYIAHFSKFDNLNMIVTENILTAQKWLSSNSEKYGHILFEKNNLEDDIISISKLKGTFSKALIILITDKIKKQDIPYYLKAGVNNTISPSADIEAIERMINFIEKKKDLVNSQNTNQAAVNVFHMPRSKRIFDIILSLIALIILSPLFILVAISIRIESKGPIIYKSKRVGSNYKIFDFLKFRSMYPDAESRLKDYIALNQYKQAETSEPQKENILSEISENDTFLFSDDSTISEKEYINIRHGKQENAFIKYEHDPRITKVGRIIRKYSIDELPQLINILKGDMSFVGNRPLPLYEAELLTSDQYVDRFIAPAGLTGLWQVEKRGSADNMSAEDRKQLDIYYAKNYSFLFDVKLIFKTFFTFIQKEDV